MVKKTGVDGSCSIHTRLETSSKLSNRDRKNDHDLIALRKPVSRHSNISNTICLISDYLLASHESD